VAERFPQEGRPAEEILAELEGGRGGDADWRAARTFSLVYNPADPGMEREVVAMAADLLHGDPRSGRLSSGGTESIFLAVQVARDHARLTRGTEVPSIVVPETAHPAFAKACHYLDVTEIRVPVRKDGRADADATAKLLDDRTALVVGSAPCYPYGVVDPIPELAALASERGVLCHVDACLGGWLLPFLERLGEPIPPWDLRVDGVTSVSADIHKYGWSFKGVSLLLHRSEELLGQQFFVFDRWPGGIYGSATTAGTRPASPIACAWATIRYLGEEGYTRLAGQIRDVARRLTEGIAEIDGLRITGDPVPGILEIASETFDMAAIGDVMDDRGWHLDRQQGGLHAILSPSHLAVVDEFLTDLRTATAEHGESRGVEARYGGV
jgi:glutamate/tyrosine decarboxylase-like PLP-dependent enzyme